MFDLIEDRFFSAGGGGGAEDNGGDGGSATSGGNGGDDGDPGEDGATPGSGGGGGGDGNNPGGNGSEGRVFVSYPIFRILPVEYLYFNAKYQNSSRTGELSWATAMEWENDRFEIERSVNNVNSWEKIGEVPGSGYTDGPIEYQYQDIKLPSSGGNIFYRLKQIDFNENFSFSDTKAIKIDPAPGTTSWNVYPNPTSGKVLNLEMKDLSSYGDRPITVRIIASNGTYGIIQVTELSSLSQMTAAYFEQKSAGVYTLEITWGDQKEYHKVILRR